MAATMASPYYDHDFDCEYWCHQCRQFVLIDGGDEIRCSACDSRFVELNTPHTQLFGFESHDFTRGEPEPPEASSAEGESPRAIGLQDSEPLLATNRFAGGSLGPSIGPRTDFPIQRNRDFAFAVPASKTAVEAMPAVIVSRENLVSECAVCNDEFNLGEVARQMPCQHIYHSHCILTWLELHSTCPLCRFQMPTVGDRDHQRPQRAEYGPLSRGRNRRFSISIRRPFRKLLACFSKPRGTRL